MNKTPKYSNYNLRTYIDVQDRRKFAVIYCPTDSQLFVGSMSECLHFIKLHHKGVKLIN